MPEKRPTRDFMEGKEMPDASPHQPIWNRERLPDWLTIQHVADYLHVSDETVYRLVRGKDFPGWKEGRRGTYRFPRDQFLSWLHEQLTTTPRVRHGSQEKAE